MLGAVIGAGSAPAAAVQVAFVRQSRAHRLPPDAGASAFCGAWRRRFAVGAANNSAAAGSGSSPPASAADTAYRRVAKVAADSLRTRTDATTSATRRSPPCAATTCAAAAAVRAPQLPSAPATRMRRRSCQFHGTGWNGMPPGAAPLPEITPRPPAHPRLAAVEQLRHDAWTSDHRSTRRRCHAMHQARLGIGTPMMSLQVPKGNHWYPLLHLMAHHRDRRCHGAGAQFFVDDWRPR